MKPEELIKTIENYPCLWDREDDDYKNCSKKEQSWQEIGRLLYGGWDDMDSKKRKELVTSAKSRWRSMRDQYVKCLHNIKSGGWLAQKKRKYQYFEELEFLRNSVQRKRTSDNFDELLKEENRSEEDYYEISESDPAETATQPEYLYTKQPSFEPSDAQSFDTEHSLSQPPFQSSASQKFDVVSEVGTSQVRQSCPTGEEDSDRMFLLSFLPSIKGLTEAEKWSFKQHMISFFVNLRIPPNQQQ
ncbi:hypothetical protein HHI36_014622 [Cryptolaemus montrouzieri]|uniref:MADF domain-containing protein n=1 Tax=Cryptolaemus montrouzieri TaxID=559131 RepID=A0ABD2N3A6_9CUCU